MDTRTVFLRPAQTSDAAFLIELRKLTMSEHLDRVGEPTDDVSHAQRVYDRFEDAKIICDCVDEERIGLLKYYRTPTEWTLVQVQILPKCQGQGLGEHVIRIVLDEARKSQLPVKLGVLKGNPAQRLYERLGFRAVSETDRELNMVFHGPGNIGSPYG
jgi:ribosomal protein S18 acetylase RimI-like enzyme